MASIVFKTLLYFFTFFLILSHFKTANADQNPAPSVTVSPKENQNRTKPEVAVSTTTNCTGNCTEDDEKHSIFKDLLNNKPMLMRAFYVLLAVTSIVVVYFVVRAWRIRRRRSKSRKYGLITARGTDLEMAPLDQDDDDEEDMTVYEMNSRNGRKK